MEYLAIPSKNLAVSMTLEDEAFNLNACIICQEDTTVPVTSQQAGRERMRRAAETRDDVVAKRIKSVIGNDEEGDDNAMFVYHSTNKCYKSYTHSGKLKAIEEKWAVEELMECEAVDDEATTSVGRRALRGSSLQCSPPSSDKDPRNATCAICGLVKHKNCREKFRICEYKSAQNLIAASKHNQDDVFARFADRLHGDEEESVRSVISADLYCHKLCRLKYIRQYERDIESQPLEQQAITNIKNVLFSRSLLYIDKLLAKGDCCTMSDLVEFAMSLVEEGEVLTTTFLNRDMKHMITSHYGDSVTIIQNSRVNESDIVFSSAINAADIALKLKNQDVMREAGTKLREDLKNVDFGLGDRFCDSTDLKTSWENTMMPSTLLTFLAALFQIPKHKLFRSDAKDLEELIQPIEDEDDQPRQGEPPLNQDHPPHTELCDEKWVRDHKSTQLHCLFQMLVYNIHNGVKQTPLHMMLGHALYARDRSKSLLTVFNRVGSCTSYQTIRSARSLLASYAVKCSEDGETPLPNTFTRVDYTMGGMDNSDYADRSSLSGTHSSHYSALVLFQDATVNRSLQKPPVSSTGLSRGDPILRKQLPCQEVPPHHKPLVRPTLPPDIEVRPGRTLLDMQTARCVAVKREFLISLIRIGAPTDDPPIWNAVHTLVSTAVVPMMRVGFLPVVPRPITERATVRHCLTNFQSVRRQLNQPSMAVWCDEGVFAPAADIYLHETEQFKDIFLCMGSFHWTRVLLRCQGKLLRGSGPDDALIECAVFGPGVIESVLNGTHYVRAITGMLIVEDLIRLLQWQMFWVHNEKASYPVLSEVEALQTRLAANERCPEKFEVLIGQVDTLRHDFQEFVKACEAKSELCQFFAVWLQMVTVVKNAVVSDREGNWDMHVSTVEDSMPIFAECDCINYLRHGSWYLEQIKVLEFTHPELYRRFSTGQWVVRDRPGWFCAVGGDMKVEQTIQRVSKGPGGHFVVGATRNASAVAEFELLFHEIGSITNLLNLLTTNSSLKHTECHLQHALSATRRISFNKNVAKLLDFVLERQNPYAITVDVPVPLPLHNLLTKVAAGREVAERLLNCLKNGGTSYGSYRQERLVDKIKKMSATISKRKLPKFNEQQQNTPEIVMKEKKATSSKDVSKAVRNIDMAKQRGMKLNQILAHDVLSASPLFDGDLPAQAHKSKLMKEIEPRLDLTEWNKESNLHTHVVVDFMSKMRQMPLAHFSSLGAVITTIITSSSHISHAPEYVHIVLDSYVDMSLKEGERMRRTDSRKGIDIIGMNIDTPVPQQLDKFWASVENKRNLQLLVRDIVTSSQPHVNANIVTSSVVSDDEALPARTSGGDEIPELMNWIEEADARLVVHVEWAVRVKKCKRVVVVSNDTDTFALLLHYTPSLLALGLQEMWQQYGTGEKKRMLPLHQAVSQLGPQLARTVIKAHILTGDDCMSKVGTKHAAMTSDPVLYLSNIGGSAILSEQDEALVERYLVRVWAGARSTSTAETFDQLRVHNYTSAGAGIDTLPPTSSVIRGHIQRGAFLVHKACQLLATAGEPESHRESLEHGWEEDRGALLPTKCLKPLPPHVLTICKCTGRCDTGRCVCRAAGVPCVIFCHGKMNLLTARATERPSCVNNR